jgi:hypothetical protein
VSCGNKKVVTFDAVELSTINNLKTPNLLKLGVFIFLWKLLSRYFFNYLVTSQK